MGKSHRTNLCPDLILDVVTQLLLYQCEKQQNTPEVHHVTMRRQCVCVCVWYFQQLSPSCSAVTAEGFRYLYVDKCTLNCIHCSVCTAYCIGCTVFGASLTSGHNLEHYISDIKLKADIGKINMEQCCMPVCLSICSCKQMWSSVIISAQSERFAVIQTVVFTSVSLGSSIHLPWC